jgi:hypothetical protein
MGEPVNVTGHRTRLSRALQFGWQYFDAYRCVVSVAPNAMEPKRDLLPESWLARFDK